MLSSGKNSTVTTFCHSALRGPVIMPHRVGGPVIMPHRVGGPVIMPHRVDGSTAKSCLLSPVNQPT